MLILCFQITDSAVCQLARLCPIRSLVLSGIHNLTDKCIFALANSRPQLEEIYLNGCAQITPAAVQYLCVSVTLRCLGGLDRSHVCKCHHPLPRRPRSVTRV